MKILYVSYAAHGSGGGVHTAQFLAALKKIHPDVAAHTPWALPPAVEAGGKNPPKPKLKGGGGAFKEIRAYGAAWLKHLPDSFRLMRDVRPDVAVLREDRYVSALWCARLFNIPVLLEVNSPFLEQDLLPPGERLRGRSFWEWHERRVLGLADHVLVVSDVLRDYYLDRGLPPNRITTRANGVDPALFHAGLDGRPVRERLGLDDQVVIGFSGAVAPWHGLEFLAKALARMAREHPRAANRVRLLLVGRRDGYEPLLPLLPAYMPVVSGFAAHDRMPEYLAAMDLFVAPYPRIEPFYFSPLKVIEAMAMGLPVLASAQGQITQLIRDGESGALYPAGNEDRFIGRLLDLIGNPEARRTMGANAARIIQTGYTWEENARTVLDICRLLVEAKGGAR
jgi:glycosyltransferase involved in cell wall biosynthesis